LRAKVLNEMADRFQEHTDDLIEILSLENGKVKGEVAHRVKARDIVTNRILRGFFFKKPVTQVVTWS
jgi:acyl-CoA reductase-like NAD-dependent aldehyde dehydrogenase